MNRTFAVGVGAFLAGAALFGLVMLGLGVWERPPGPPSPTPEERQILYWRAPMDPDFTSDRPGKSPMGMDLVPVYADEADSPPEGAVRLDPTFVQRVGVRTAPVERRDIARTIRTVGTLDHNDRQIAWINTKFAGWIENVAVNYLGQTVEKGQVLFDIYSPQVVTTQDEYLRALHYAGRLDATKFPDAAERARSLVESARARLRFWDVTDEQIEALEREETPKRTLSVVSPVTGVVVDKLDEALDGMYVQPGTNLYKVADLTTIWVDVEVFEHQVGAMRIGQRAEVELPHVPGGPYTGFVRYLYPHFDQQTRTMTASIELTNPDLTLRAGMYANVMFEVAVARDALTAPETAVIRSGTRELVVLELSPGLFRVAEVQVGVDGDGIVEIRAGIAEGDRVVVSGQFLIDSESNLTQVIKAPVPEPGAREPEAEPATIHRHH